VNDRTTSHLLLLERRCGYCNRMSRHNRTIRNIVLIRVGGMQK
jgi:hypothetical protein